MERLLNFLLALQGDVFRLLPMKEEEINGDDNYVQEYLHSLIVNIEGAAEAYPILGKEKTYLYIINNLRYLAKDKADFNEWRRIVLYATRTINNLYITYCEVAKDGERGI